MNLSRPWEMPVVVPGLRFACRARSDVFFLAAILGLFYSTPFKLVFEYATNWRTSSLLSKDFLRSSIMGTSPPIIQGWSSTSPTLRRFAGLRTSSLRIRSLASSETCFHTKWWKVTGWRIVFLEIYFSSRLSKGKWRPNSKKIITPIDQQSTAFS